MTYPNLEALADGRIPHGTLSEYPLLRAEAKQALGEITKLRELLGRARTHLVYSTKNPHEPDLAALIDEIDSRK